MPTAVNNVETLSTVPWILRHGGAENAKVGTENSKLKLLSEHTRQEIDHWVAKFPPGKQRSACIAALREARHERPLEWRDGEWVSDRRRGPQLLWFPEPVGAEISVVCRARIDGQPSCCGSVGVPKRLTNQSRTSGCAQSKPEEIAREVSVFIPNATLYLECF